MPESRLAHRYHWATPDFRQTAGVNVAFPEIRPDLIDVSRSNLSVEWTAGGLVATPRSLARYGVALRDGQFLSTRSMAFMTEGLPIAEGVQAGYGLNRVESPDGLVFVGHGGNALGFSAMLFWIEGSDTVVAVTSNVGSMHSGEVPGTAVSVGTDGRFVELAMRMTASK